MSIQRAIQPEEHVFLDPVLQRHEDALKVLEAESREVISVDAGPVQIGTIEDAFTDEKEKRLLSRAAVSEIAERLSAARA